MKRSKKGISLVALVITIVVMIILSGAVVITGINVPQNAQLAVFHNNIGIMQEATTTKMLNNRLKYVSERSELYKWVDVIEGYTEESAAGGIEPTFAVNAEGKYNGQAVAALSNVVINSTSISEEEGSKYYVDRDGIVYHEGKDINGQIHFNQTSQTGIYGIKRKIDSSSTAWERIGDSKDFKANATLYGVLSGGNDFDTLHPWSSIKSYNYNTETNKITAWYGESGYKADGSNGDVLTYIPAFWYKRIQEDGYEYIYISSTDPKDSTYTKSEAFSIARYETYVENNKAYSRSGVIPKVSTNINTFRTITTGTDENYCLMDYRYFALQLLYLVEYADYNSQTKLGNGFTHMRYTADDKALVAETGTNRVVVSETVGNQYIVGQQISIGTSLGSHNISNRTITAKEAYNQDGVTGTAIYFDGATVNISVGNVLYNSAQKTGSTDSLGMRSGTPGVAKTTGVIYRGVENIFGNTWTWVDGINIKNNEVFVCYNPANYVSSTFTGNYVSVGTMPSKEGYQKTVGYNANHPLITYPKEVGGGASTYISDYYYTNSGADRALFVGGRWNAGTLAGLWYWNTHHAPSDSWSGIGARLLKYQ